MRIWGIVSLLLFCFVGGLEASEPEIVISFNRAKQGRSVRSEIRTDRPLKTASVTLSRRTFQFFLKPGYPKNGRYVYSAYIGVARRLAVKRHFLWFKLVYEDGEVYKTRYKFWVLSGRFPKEHITLSKAKKKLARDSKGISDENQRMAEVYRLASPKKYFEKPFIVPVEPVRVTSPFGRMRVYNGKPSWPHSGVDFGKGYGATIMAANDGKVVLREEFLRHGNTVVIDHGWGVLSIYNHLQEFSVKVGDIVRRGQKIGTMGSTGIATGPHLHWGISVGDVRVDPMFWLDRKFLYD